MKTSDLSDLPPLEKITLPTSPTPGRMETLEECKKGPSLRKEGLRRFFVLPILRPCACAD